jgi:hypothetical protein
MSQIYIEKWSEVIDSDHLKYVFSDRIRTGSVLHVYNCFAYSAERDANETVQIGVLNGGTNVLVRSRAGSAAKEGVSALNHFLVGEGDQVYAYFPSADNEDTIELHIIGELFSLEEWRGRLKG